ncbi:MAG: phenylalanine--tRNA ligase subunit beta [Nitratiruptor sp.]|nr:phenylalanine--tRNA ligase subunit beta [Nitratiruptor sp.]NPA83164.1 phenylalanine--tRNA ligase subunit beta [Campylobacterota bacterium]
MIVTRSWLQEWIDLSDTSTSELIKTLNRIGLEVAQVYRLSLPEGVVVGRVLSCQRHPNADKLSLCEVDIGKERLQIVCGAKNAQYARYVAVATVGTKLPGGIEIAPVKLRGIESAGMLCSAKEVGLPPIEDGIMLLDESIGTLIPGMELRDLPLFQDEVIDIELTPNRGDCLSILGIARELACALGKKLKTIDLEESNALQIGIGRLLNLNVARDVEANLIYKAFSAKNFTNPFLIRFRLALVGERFSNRADEFAYYITHSTGVITRIYGYDFFDEGDAPAIVVQKDEQAFDAVYGREKGSIIGVIQYEGSKPSREEERFIIEASYIDPERISKRVYETKIQGDWEFYRSSRGSEPRLEIALRYFKYLLRRYYTEFMVYAGTHEAVREIEREAIKIDFETLDHLIGQPIERSAIVEILKSLEFEILSVTEESMVLRPPLFRHDIANVQDVAEEIVRIYGIDRIAPKPLCFREANRLNRSYETFQKERLLRTLATGAGYFETISFIFTSKERLERYQMPRLKEAYELVNPITKELNTLRTSLIPNLLEQVERNVKNGKDRVKLFEVGTVFTPERQERKVVGFAFAGKREPEGVFNQGKPGPVTFADMVRDLASILGPFELRRSDPINALMHPYQSALLIQRGEPIGLVFKLTLPIQEELDLPPTYLAELDFDQIDLSYPKAQPFSIYQLSWKDLSILVDRELDFAQIKEALFDLPKEVKRFYPIDLYSDERLGSQRSLTIRFAIQSDEKTLTEEEIGGIMEEILHKLETRVGARLR